MEPSLSWGLRMALTSVIPVIWGVASGRLLAAEWIALSAESVCWVALKGTYAQRIRVLAGGAVLTLACSALGSVTGDSLILSVGCMLVIAFLTGLFKTLGERGSGLSLCLYVMFLISNARAVYGQELEERLLYVLIGGVWNAALGLVSVFFTRAEQPYRRTIALIWRSAAALMQKIAQGWDGKSVRSSQRGIYLAEKAVRDAIDTSFAFHERAAHQVRGKEDGAEFQLAQVRKAAALVAAHMTAIAGELEGLQLQATGEDLRLRLRALMQALQRATERMGVFVLTRRPEEELLMRESLEHLRQQLDVLAAYEDPRPLQPGLQLQRIIQLGERCLKLLSRGMDLLADVSERRMFRSYSLIKTIYILHPSHWWRNIRLLFSPDSHTTRYAARTAIAATVATAIYKWFDIDHGYWLPFTVIIILQPYFIATIRKALDRLIGTIFGGAAGSLLLLLPAGLHMKEAMLFVSAIAMVHFLRTKYRISAFFITLNLVLLFSVSQELNRGLIFWRAGLTLGGAIIAVAAGFLLLPAWDRKWLPGFVAKALDRNWCYFRYTFSAPAIADQTGWTRYKRQAEVSNSNVFDSFNRAMQEPGGLRRMYAAYYQLITHNVRITRELNNIHLEEEEKSGPAAGAEQDPETEQLIQDCTNAFREALQAIRTRSGRQVGDDMPFTLPEQLPQLNAAQKLGLRRVRTELTLMRENLNTLNGTLPGTPLAPA
jgi:uncharacterized membrane protein YccC